MQLNLLRELCGSEVDAFDEADFADVPEGWETVLLLDTDCSQQFVTLAGPPGSFDRLLRALEEDPSLASGENGGWQVCKY